MDFSEKATKPGQFQKKFIIKNTIPKIQENKKKLISCIMGCLGINLFSVSLDFLKIVNCFAKPFVK